MDLAVNRISWDKSEKFKIKILTGLQFWQGAGDHAFLAGLEASWVRPDVEGGHHPSVGRAAGGRQPRPGSHHSTRAHVWLPHEEQGEWAGLSYPTPHPPPAPQVDALEVN